LVAVVPGVATSGQNSLGGNVVYLAGDDGHRYYYAHLDRWGRLGRVAAGDVIGYMGDTGNAVGVPHLHFEIRPGGGPNVNPYPTVRAYC
jgi:murein DD-endopeptidase MepM/ murein hydrolase activator NlpD